MSTVNSPIDGSDHRAASKLPAMTEPNPTNRSAKRIPRLVSHHTKNSKKISPGPITLVKKCDEIVVSISRLTTNTAQNRAINSTAGQRRIGFAAADGEVKELSAAAGEEV